MVKVLKVRRLGAGGQLAVSKDELRFLGWDVGTRVVRIVERTPDGPRLVFEKAPEEAELSGRG